MQYYNSADTGHFTRMSSEVRHRTTVFELKRSEYRVRVNNPMLHCKVLALVVFIFLISMISTVRFAKHAPKFSTKFRRVVQASTASLATSIPRVTHPSYDEIDTFTVAEYGLRGSLYKHKQSGAEVVSVAAPDDNKVFGITFRTPPKDSTGLPHILEHSVLCGSRKFPVKEPFVDLLRGSLQNFLNAFTYPDRTCYPVASTNTKDFYNLVNVYLDAVLHPRAVNDPQVLQQEGWHYEVDGDNASGALSIKGVVYNEMKGVYSSPDSILGRATQRALFPDNAYSVDSGGDPQRIPDLTFEQFKAFHAQYYHPSNSRVFFYGDDDPLQRLVLLDQYLSDFRAAPEAREASSVAYQPRLPEPRRVEVSFPISENAELKHMVTVNWVLNHEPLRPRDSLALAILDHLLLGTSSAPLKKALIESNLGESLAGGGLSDELLQATFGAGLKGVLPGDTTKVEALVHSTLARLAEEGFDPADVQAAVNTVEFKLREFNTGGFPKGLSVMLGMMQHWVYDRDPLDGVRFEQPLRDLKADIESGVPVFQDLLRKLFVSNTHQVTVEMKPDASLEERRLKEEAALLDGVKKDLSHDQVQQIIASAAALRVAQEAPDSPEARATLPRLTLGDIDPQAKELPIAVLDEAALRAAGIRDATVLLHELETSGILYADLALDYSGVDPADLELLPLFTRMLMESGTAHYDLAELTRKIGTSTGGITVSLHNDLKSDGNRVVSGDQALLYLLVRGKAVRDNLPMLFQLFTDILLSADLGNQKRAVEMLRESKARKEAAILSAGHTFAATRISSRQSFLGHLNEVTGGLTSVRRAGTLLEQASSDWSSVEARLQRMRRAIIGRNKDRLVVSLTGDAGLTAAALPHVKAFVDAIPESADKMPSVVSRWDAPAPAPAVHEAFVMPSQVNYVAKGGPMLAPGSEVKGGFAVATRYLSTGHLWDQVRVVGGAYGGFARFSEATGRFVYLSYRDPNCLETLNVYDGSPDALSEAELSSEDLLQAIIGTIGDLDSPLSADQKGLTSLVRFLNGQTATDRQRRRTEILSTTDKDFKEFASLLRGLREAGSVTVFGAQSAVDEANSKLPEQRRMKVEQALLGVTNRI